MPPELADRYRIVRELGRGATSVVYLAIQRSLGRDVVLKLLASPDEEARQRFLREARILSRLDLPGVAGLLDYGQLQEALYLVSAYQEGQTVSRILSLRRSLPWKEAATIVRSVADTLGSVHASGVLHRDVKPANLLVRPAGDVVLLDFGSGLVAGEAGLTAQGSFLGTAPYAAPERILARSVDGRSDLYSLGVVIVEMLTGENPFAAGSLPEIINRQLNKRLRELPALEPPMPRALAQLILELLEKDPRNRPRGGQAVARRIMAALQDASEGGEGATRPGEGGVRPHAPVPAGGPTGAVTPRADRWPDRPRGWRGSLTILLAAAAALATLLALAASMVRHARSPGPAESAVQEASPSHPAARAGGPREARPGRAGIVVGLVEPELILTGTRLFFRARTVNPVRLGLALRQAGRRASTAADPSRACWHRLDLPLEPGRGYVLEPSLIEPEGVLLARARTIAAPAPGRPGRGGAGRAGPSTGAHRSRTGGQGLLAALDDLQDLAEFKACVSARDPSLWTEAGVARQLAYLELLAASPHSLEALVGVAGRSLDPGSPPGLRLRQKLEALLDPERVPDDPGSARSYVRLTMAAVRGLCEVGDPASLAAIARFLGGGHLRWLSLHPGTSAEMRDARREALEVLARYHPQVAASLAGAMERHETAAERGMASWLEAQLPAAMRSIGAAGLLSSREVEVRRGALRALLIGGREGARAEILAWARQEPDARACGLGAMVLSLSPGPEASMALEGLEARLAAVPGQEAETARILALRALGSSGGEEALGVLERRAGDASPRLRAAVWRSLADLAFRRPRTVAKRLPAGLLRALETPGPGPATDPGGERLMAAALGGIPGALDQARRSMDRGTNYQRWVAGVCLAARRERLPGVMPMTPEAGTITAAELQDRVAPVWTKLAEMFRKPAPAPLTGGLFLLDPGLFGIDTGVRVGAGDHVVVEVAGLATAADADLTGPGGEGPAAASPARLLAPPGDLWLSVRTGRSLVHLERRRGPAGGSPLELAFTALDPGTAILRAGLRAHPDIEHTDPLHLPAHPGLLVVRLEVTSRFSATGPAAGR